MPTRQGALSRAPFEPLHPLLREAAGKLQSGLRKAEATGRDAVALAGASARSLVPLPARALLTATEASIARHAPTRALAERPSARSAPAGSGQRRPAMTSAPATRARTSTIDWRNLGAMAAATANGAGDAFTLGMGDPYAAAKYAWDGVGVGQTWRERYDSLRALQLAQDQYDAKHHPKARLAGEVVGAVGSIAATGGVGGAAQAGVRGAQAAGRIAPQAARFGARAALPYATIAAGGAVTSVGGQGASDVLNGHWSSPEAYGSAALGGGAGALATARLGPRAGATLEAGVTHSALAGGPVDWEAMQRDAVVGSHFGRIGDVAGTKWADGLHFTKKGKLGERMSEAKTWLQGERPVERHRRRKVAGGDTVIDHATDSGSVIEAKFGRWARLSRRQIEAMLQYGPRYRVDWWLPEHVGRAVGGPLALFSAQAAGREDER